MSNVEFKPFNLETSELNSFFFYLTVVLLSTKEKQESNSSVATVTILLVEELTYWWIPHCIDISIFNMTSKLKQNFYFV